MVYSSKKWRVSDLAPSLPSGSRSGCSDTRNENTRSASQIEVVDELIKLTYILKMNFHKMSRIYATCLKQLAIAKSVLMDS